MENTGKMRVLGVMSGTSLDGLDLALCEFEPTGNSWRYCVLKAKTINYPMLWKDFLGRASTMKLDHYLAISNSYGSYIADEINAFLKGSEHPDAIASHGHTVFHHLRRRCVSRGRGAEGERGDAAQDAVLRNAGIRNRRSGRLRHPVRAADGIIASAAVFQRGSTVCWIG